MHRIPSETATIRSRPAYATLVVAAIAMGLASRRFADAFPEAVRLYAGDVLWAAMVYFTGAVIWRRATVARLATGTLVFSLLIETSQLYHARWIDAARATRLGGLVLGYGFLWSDVVCYAVGVGLAAAIDGVLRRRLVARSLRPDQGGAIVS